jgi:hypothetical protein
MKKIIRKVVKSFKRLSDSKLLTFGQTVVAAVGGAPGVFPTPTPVLADITTQLNAYRDLIQTSATRDKVQVEFKNQAKAALNLMLSQLADYVNLTAQGDAAILAQSGFALNKIPEPITLAAPTRVTLEDGGNSGEMVLKFKGAKGASSYLFQYTSDTMLGDNSWITIPATTTSYTFSGLNKGTTYFCRAVAVGANQQLMNSIVVNRVSQ